MPCVPPRHAHAVWSPGEHTWPPEEPLPDGASLEGLHATASKRMHAVLSRGTPFMDVSEAGAKKCVMMLSVRQLRWLPEAHAPKHGQMVNLHVCAASSPARLKASMLVGETRLKRARLTACSVRVNRGAHHERNAVQEDFRRPVQNTAPCHYGSGCSFKCSGVCCKTGKTHCHPRYPLMFG